MKRITDQHDVTIKGGIELTIRYHYQAGRQTHEINDPDELEIVEVTPVEPWRMSDILDYYPSLSRATDDIKSELYRLVL